MPARLPAPTGDNNDIRRAIKELNEAIRAILARLAAAAIP